MSDLALHSDASPVLTDIPRFEQHIEPAYRYERQSSPPIRLHPLNVALFLLTLLTTTMAGAYSAGAPVVLGVPASLPNLVAGLPFSIPLMLILFAHEMGHYLTSRRYGVDSSLPYFIPAPFPSLFFVGTFGAFIRMRRPPRTRREMFDIGAAGPWAGFVVAVIATAIGLSRSQVTPLDTTQGGLFLGNSMLFWGVSRVVLGVDPNSVNVNVHPIALAGWIGLLVTAINLLPVGQLDGGHVIYSLLGGRWHRIVSRAAWIGCGLMVLVPYLLHLNFWGGWLLWFVLLIALGLGHPATTDTDMPLRGSRKLGAWATILLFVITFTPVPVSLVQPNAPLPGHQGHTYDVMQPGHPFPHTWLRL
ncbi:MAG TPA: site-2 protease family protein [Candidatus Binataceae bacterium]|nr:site-2 protease family protein [Candidatus Binataceae bacterium]